MASRAAAICFFFHFFFLVGKYCPVLEKRIVGKNEIKSPQSALLETPGRSTGNRILFLDWPNLQ